jgi:hypothetical protein
MDVAHRIVLAAALIAASSPLAAQGTQYALAPAVGAWAPPAMAPADADQWQWTIAPYLLFPSMQGTTGIGDLPLLHVDASPSDIFSHLHFGAMLYVQARKGTWAFVLDQIYMDLRQDVSPGPTWVTGNVTMKQYAAEAFAFKELSHGFEAAVGGLVNSIQARGEITILAPDPGGPFTQSNSKTKTWGVPVVGFRWTPVSTDRWHLVLFSDIGGTSGNNWTYQVLPSVGYKWSKLFETALQYRWLGLNYSTGSGSDTFIYDMNIFGPEVAFAFHF